MYSAKEKRGTIYLKKKLINKKYNPAALQPTQINFLAQGSWT